MVSINLLNGNEVLDTTVIAVTATDDKGVIGVEILLDNVVDATFLVPPYTYVLDANRFADSSTHIIYARAYDADGNISSSQVLTVTTFWLQPTQLTIDSIMADEIDLSWVDNSRKETGFEVERSINSASFSMIEMVGANITTVTSPFSFSPGDTVRYRVRAFSSTSFSRYSNTVSSSYTGPPIPISENLFPLTVGNKLTYTGYATAPGTGAQIPDPTGSYRTVWTIVSNAAPSPLGGTATAVVDSTTGPFGPGGFVVTVARTLLIQQDGAGDYLFMQTIGPFKRAFGVPVGSTAEDTLIWVAVAMPSQGVGSTGAAWTAYDSSFAGAAGDVRLEIFGMIEATEVISDSTLAFDGLSTERFTYRSRTWRKITLDGNVIQDDVTTTQFWFAPDLGPAQIDIRNDTENFGHFRTLSAINF